jgi:hypothetical protein
MGEVFKYNFRSVYAEEDTYNLFFHYYARVNHKQVSVVNKEMSSPDLIVIPSGISLSEQESKKYRLIASNSRIKGYLKITAQ